MPIVYRTFLLWLLAGAPAAQPVPAHHPAAGVALPPRLARLLAPPPGDARQDIRRLRAARAQWAGDSLGRLLVQHRLGADFGYLQQADSALYYMRQAWWLAGPAQRRQQPADVVEVANGLGHLYHKRGSYDSAAVYYRHAIAVFTQAGLDSSRGSRRGTFMLSTHEPWGEGGWALASSAANADSALRQSGDLRRALLYYERARALYELQRSLPGVIWTQSLIGEAYAEQGDPAQALLAYEQALRTARRRQRQDFKGGSLIQADLVLDYYIPLLLTAPGRRGQASRVATATIQMLRAAYSDSALRTTPYNVTLLARLHLVLAEEALRAGQPAAAAPYLREAAQWLTRAAPSRDQPYYRRAATLLLGLRAWQQHAADPATSRRLLTQATTLLTAVPADNAPARLGPPLAGYCLAMGEPALAQHILQPLLRDGARRLGPAARSRATALLAQAYAGTGRYDSAYAYAQRAQTLADTLRAARQFAAVAATEARFRTREQAAAIRQLTERDRQQVVQVQLAAAGAALLALLLLGAGAAWRTTRRLNQRLAAQSTRLQAQAERLGELDAAKNQFFANVSHELRTPLTLVLGPLDGLLTTPPAPLPEATRGPVALAYRSAQRLRELVNRILDLTKLEAGRLELLPAPTALASLLRRVVAQFESLAAERRIALVAPAAPPEHLRLLLDADKVEQILTNLLINALNHTPAGGAVVVSAALPAPDGQYELTVRDTGPGIAPGEQARVFERFYQSPQRQAQGGTGLGLALSRELATLLGGTLALVSEPGQGAAFTLRFPAEELRVESEELRVGSTGLEDDGAQLEYDSDEAGAAEPEATATDPTTKPSAPGANHPTQNSELKTQTSPKPRVLVVEDQPDLRDYLRQLLSPAYEVLTATDGQDALDVLSREAPVDLITTDAMMPRLSGTELLARLKADPARAGLPVLMLTARADDAHRQTALTVGVDDYLTKPFVASELLARVQALLVRHAVRRQFAALPAEVVVAEAAPPATTAPAAAAPGPGEVALTTADAAGQLAQWQAQLAAHLPNPEFGPAELAGLLNMSERTLYRRLGELAGLTPAAWLRELRLHHARRLLEAGDFDSVAAVAEAAGFGNAKAFSARYTERFGRRPGDYRR